MKNKSLTIGLTYDIANDHMLKSGDPKDLFSEFDNPTIVRGIRKAIERLGFTVELVGNFRNVLTNIVHVKNTVDIIFNTAEGLYGRNREAQIPLILEYYGIPFVGSDALSMSLTLDKVITKKILIADGIPTPKFLITEVRLKERDVSRMKFPLIVKPQWEGSSKGMTAKSKVENIRKLNEQINLIVSKYHQPALIEEFIAGRESTVVLIGNGKDLVVYPPLEIRIRHGIVGDKIYVGRYVYSNDVTYECPAKFPKTLTDEITALAERTYKSVGCLDFGRVDFRIDDKGNPFVLEINPLPALSKQDAFGTIAKSLSLTYDIMIQRVLLSGLKRYQIL